MALTKSNSLTKNYVLVLVTLGLLALGNYYLLESVVASQASGAAEINIAGRQRMLSQRITLLTNQIQNLTDKQHIQIVSKKLADAIDLMRQSHLALVDGNEELGLLPASTDELKAMYFGPKSFVDTQVQAFLGYAEEYMNEHGTLGISVSDWHEFGNSETESLLRDLDAVVGQYQKESDAKVARLRNYQIVALAATLIFLGGTGLFVFRPMTSRINKSISELSDAEERFRSITKSSSAVIIIAADQQGRIISWNPGAAAAFGYSESEMLGQLVIDLVPERYKSAHTEGFQRAIHSEEYRILGKTIEIQALRKGGEEFPVELSLGTWKQGAHRYFSAIMHDVTARNQTEAALRRTQKMEAIGELTGGLAHDFNNLLGIIIGNLDLMGRKIEDGSKLQKQLGKAQNAALRGSELTRRLLNFSKTAPEENSPLDINKVIGNLEDLIGKSLTAEVQIETALDNDLWMVEINPGDLEDAIVNLALNARDAMPNGGQLVLETRNTVLDDTVGDLGDGLEPGEYVEIAVSDNGHGMPREVSDKIFEPFFTTKEQDKGTGLGLAMVYGFVRRAKGYISVYSEVNVGTTFRLYLPRSRSMSEQTEIPVDADAPLPTGTETVLIVDDEHDLAEAAKSILDGLGYTTVCAHNGDEALKILDKDRSIDLLFSDVVMAGSINGFSLADTAIVMKPELKVLMTSGFTGKMQHDGDTERWRKTLIAKPYRYTDLAIRVRAVLDGRA